MAILGRRQPFAPILGVPAAVAGAVTGSLAVTEAADVLVGAAGVLVGAAGSLAEGADTLAGVGAVAVGATGAVTEGADSLAGAGAVAVAGAAGVTESPDALAGVGLVGNVVIGSGAATEAADVLAASGVVAVGAAGSITEQADTLTAVGVVGGSVAVTPRPIRGRWSPPSRAGRFSPPSRAGRWSFPMPVTDQTLSPIYVGEDAAPTLTGTTDPTGWAVRFTLLPLDGSPVVVSSPTITVSGPTAGKWTFTIPLPHATTILLAVGVAGWQFHRTDTGSVWLLADGTVDILPPKAELP